MRLSVFDRLDRYTLGRLAGPLLAVLAILLVAQLLERLLRLIDLVARAGAPLSSVFAMFANLVPHYLGLALPMAFTAAVFMATARLSDDHELDVMLAAGRSIVRIAAPFFAIAVLLVPFNLLLYAEWQPFTRYAYRAAVNAVLQTGWDAKVEPNRFIDASDGSVFSTDAVDADGRGLTRVFVERRHGGAIEVTTATRGRFGTASDGSGLALQLGPGVRLREGSGDDDVSVARFAEADIERKLSAERRPFRERGGSVRERTLGELWNDSRPGGDPQAAGELHGRLARAVILPLLPLLAMPLGMAARGGRRTPAVVFLALALLAVNQALQLGESLAESGRLAAAPAVWTPFAAFAVLAVVVFRGSLAWPGDNPVLRAVRALERLIDGMRQRRVRTAPA